MGTDTRQSRFSFPAWAVWYKKPDYRDIREYSNAAARTSRPSTPASSKSAIPGRLRLERIISNKTCSPMSLFDFYMYLRHIEYSAENLEFYLWYVNYESDWYKNKDDFGTSRSTLADDSDGEEGQSRKAKGSEPAGDSNAAEDALDQIAFLISANAVCIPAARCCRPQAHLRDRDGSAGDGRGSSLIPPSVVAFPPFSAEARPASLPDTAAAHPRARARTPAASLPAQLGKPEDASLAGPDGSAEHPSPPGLPAAAAAPTTAVTHPFRPLPSEVRTVVKLFLLPGSAKELNIPPAMRDAALSALRTSSDPKHLRPVADHAYGLLRNCSHRNFVRLGVANGTYETVCVATGLGIVLTVAGFLFVLLRAFHPATGAHSRWNVFGAWPFWWLGLSLVLSGLRGSCFFLLLFSRRQPLPWERFGDEASTVSRGVRGDAARALSRMMIFDRKMRVQDRHLRRLQHKIVLQSMAGGSVMASAGVLLFIFLPIWKETVRGQVGNVRG